MLVNTLNNNDCHNDEVRHRSMVSPTNGSGTSISALTFDESIFNYLNMHSSGRPVDLYSHTNNNKTPHELDPRFLPRYNPQIKSSTCHRDENTKTYARGTLLGRIMQQLNQQNHGQDDSATIHPCLNTKDLIETNINSKQETHDDFCKIIETMTSKRDENVRMVDDTSSVHEVSLSSGESASDEWREVQDPVTEKTYYYNRRTRQSTWILPLNAMVTRRREKKWNQLSGIGRCELNDHEGTVTPEKNKNIQHVTSSNINKTSSSSSEVLNMVDSKSSFNAPNHDNCTRKEKVRTMDIFSLSSSSKKPKMVFCTFCGEKLSLVFMSHHLNICGERTRAEELSPGMGQTILKMLIDSHSQPHHHESNHISFSNENQRSEIDVDDDDDDDNNNDVEKGNVNSQNVHKLQERPNALDKKSIHVFEDRQEMTRKRLTSDMTSSHPNYELRPIDSSISHEYGYEEEAEEEEFLNTLYCSCPFCRRPFKSGNKLSRHLLCCRERRNSSRKRRSGSTRNDGTSYTITTTQDSHNSPCANLQTTLIIDGGRSLPGYPKLIRSPLQK